MNRYAVILAGGGGTRFWPLSRQNSPKQLLNLSGNDIMINETISRLEGIVPINNTFIVTGEAQAASLKSMISDSLPKQNIICEPVGRNTAPCILYSAMLLERYHGEGVMCILPSDHFIENIAHMQHTLSKSMEMAEQSDSLITIGIKPTFAATGYGYICFDKSEENNGFYAVEDFVEKPSYKVAEHYFRSGQYLWNSGMFIWKTSVIIESFRRFLPKMYDKMQEIMESMPDVNYVGEAQATQASDSKINHLYPQLQSISIDFGIMERADNVLVIPGDFGWNDVGSWDSLGAIFKPDENGNIIKAEHIGIDTKNCIVYGNGRLISTIGLESLIVVNTDDALLICPKSRAQDVKTIVEKLKQDGKGDLL